MADIIREARKLMPTLDLPLQIEVEQLCDQLEDAQRFNYGTIEQRTTAQLRNILEKNGVRLPRGKGQGGHDHLWD